MIGLVAASLAWALPQTVSASPLGFVTIGGRHYATGNVKTLASRLARTTDFGYVLAVIARCRSIQSQVFAGSSGVGLTAYLTLSSDFCLSSPNGGPEGGGPLGGPCLQVFKTPEDPDPQGAKGLLGGEPRSYVLFAGTGATVCQDISTQVPGGVWARTGASVPGLPAGSVALVKCQAETSGGLTDYLAPPASSLPHSKPTYWLNDYYFESGTTAGRLPGVPSCYGVDIEP
jgi:hypothetical protein